MSRSLSSTSVSAGKKVRLQRKFYEKLDDFTSRVLLHSESGYVVYRAKCRYSLGIVVLKGYGRDILNKANKLRIMKEVEILQQNECPFLLRCFDCFEDQGWWWLVLENCAGGDLYGITQTHPDASSNDGWLASQVVLPMLQTLAYLHEEGIMHRDIKPEHVMFNSEKVAKLGGFFLAHDLAEQGLPTDMVGEMQYSAPEMIISGQHAANNKRYCYDHKVDIWSLGVLIYECLVGEVPFHDDDPKIMADLIINSDPSLPPYLTEEAKDFLMQTLQKDPEEREEASALLDHPWITGNLDWIPEQDFEDPVILSSYYNGMEDNQDFAIKKCWGIPSAFSSLVGWMQGKNASREEPIKGRARSWLPSACRSEREQVEDPSHHPPYSQDRYPAGQPHLDPVLLAKASFKQSYSHISPIREMDDENDEEGLQMLGTAADPRGLPESPHPEMMLMAGMQESPDLQIPHGHLLPLDPNAVSPYITPRHPLQPDGISPRVTGSQLEMTARSNASSRVASPRPEGGSVPNALVSDLPSPLRRHSSGMLASQWQRAPTEPMSALTATGGGGGGAGPPVYPDPTLPYPGPVQP